MCKCRSQKADANSNILQLINYNLFNNLQFPHRTFAINIEILKLKTIKIHYDLHIKHFN